MCVVREMAKSLFRSVAEVLQLLLCFVAIVGIPVAVIYVAGVLIAIYCGEKARDIVGIIFLLCVETFFLVSAIREWYLKAKEKCAIKR